MLDNNVECNAGVVKKWLCSEDNIKWWWWWCGRRMMDFSAHRFFFFFSVLCKIKAATALLAVDCWLLLCCTHWWRGSISLMQWKRRNVNWILCTLILTTPTLSCCTQLFCIHPRLSLFFFFFFPLARWLDGMELAGIEKNMFRVQDLWIFKLRSFSGIRRRKWSYILWNFSLRLTFYGPQKYFFWWIFRSWKKFLCNHRKTS